MRYYFLILLWAGYCFLHSFLISIRFTNFLTRMLKKNYAFYRFFYILISLVLLIPLLNYSNASSNRIIIVYTEPWSTIRTLLMWGSLLMFFWAFFFNYDSLSFFGIRQILNRNKSDTPVQPGGLSRKGLLGLTRHPMYLALIVYLWSQTFRDIDILINTVLTVYVIIGTLLEEKKLVLEFGDAYVQYQKEVPILIPFLKWNRT